MSTKDPEQIKTKYTSDAKAQRSFGSLSVICVKTA